MSATPPDDRSSRTGSDDWRPPGSDGGWSPARGYGPQGSDPSGPGAPGYGPAGYGAPGYGAPRERENPSSGMVALVSGILGLTLLPVIGSIVALVAGYQSRREAAEQPYRYRDDYGRIGRILGWVGLGLLAVSVVVFVIALVFIVGIGAAASSAAAVAT